MLSTGIVCSRKWYPLYVYKTPCCYRRNPGSIIGSMSRSQGSHTEVFWKWLTKKYAYQIWNLYLIQFLSYSLTLKTATQTYVKQYWCATCYFSCYFYYKLYWNISSLWLTKLTLFLLCVHTLLKTYQYFWVCNSGIWVFMHAEMERKSICPLLQHVQNKVY